MRRRGGSRALKPVVAALYLGLVVWLTWAVTAADGPRPATPATFGGYLCRSSSCAGHRAGYGWAVEQGVASIFDCGGETTSFNEGCRAWASLGASLTRPAPEGH